MVQQGTDVAKRQQGTDIADHKACTHAGSGAFQLFKSLAQRPELDAQVCRESCNPVHTSSGWTKQQRHPARLQRSSHVGQDGYLALGRAQEPELLQTSLHGTAAAAPFRL